MDVAARFSISRRGPVTLLICLLGGVISTPILGKCQPRETEVPPEVHDVPLLDEGTVRAGIARLLDSNDVRNQAWGASFIGERGLKELVPRLQDLLERSRDANPFHVHSLRLVVLDSLIRLNASIPEEKLRPLFGEYPEQVIILLAIDPVENRDALLAIAEKTKRGRRWAAVCNLLAETKAPGFAALMLKDLKIEARVHVFDYGSHSVGVGGGEVWGSVVCGVRQNPKGFPPVSHYRFEDRPVRGAVVLSTGRRTIYYQRLVASGTSQQPFSWPDSGGHDDLERAEYLAALLDASKEELGFDPQPSFAVIWSDAEQFRTEVEGIRNQVRMKYNDLIARLVSNRLLSETEAASLRPQISITVVDSRENPSTPLPEIERERLAVGSTS